jgi:nitroreductase/NAD-dependent dihydropyrimidine dehydrogenase PreA subunit
MNQISIKNKSCTRCGRCVGVCPTEIFRQEGKASDIALIDIESCIACGHCVAVCPTESVVHSTFPEDKIHPIDYKQMPTPEQVLLLCQARRSNRAFSQKEIPAAYLEQILHAAHLAPTASNLQEVEFTLVTSPEKLALITDFTLDIFASLAKILNFPLIKAPLKPFLGKVYKKLVPGVFHMVEERKKGNDLILRGATAVLFIHTPAKNRFGCQDANLAYQNASLMAESLGVGQFYTGFVSVAVKQNKSNRLAKQLGIKGTIHAGMALGMPSFRFPNYMDKKDIRVNRV